MVETEVVWSSCQIQPGVDYPAKFKSGWSCRFLQNSFRRCSSLFCSNCCVSNIWLPVAMSVPTNVLLQTFTVDHHFISLWCALTALLLRRHLTLTNKPTLTISWLLMWSSSQMFAFWMQIADVRLMRCLVPCWLTVDDERRSGNSTTTWHSTCCVVRPHSETWTTHNEACAERSVELDCAVLFAWCVQLHVMFVFDDSV